MRTGLAYCSKASGVQTLTGPPCAMSVPRAISATGRACFAAHMNDGMRSSDASSGSSLTVPSGRAPPRRALFSAPLSPIRCRKSLPAVEVAMLRYHSSRDQGWRCGGSKTRHMRCPCPLRKLGIWLSARRDRPGRRRRHHRQSHSDPSPNLRPSTADDVREGSR